MKTAQKSHKKMPKSSSASWRMNLELKEALAE